MILKKKHAKYEEVLHNIKAKLKQDCYQNCVLTMADAINPLHSHVFANIKY